MKESKAAPVQVDPAQGETTQLPTQVDVKIHTLYTSGSVRADASINLNGCFAVRGVKLIDSESGPFVSMPSYQTRGEYKDVCFPVTKEFRQQLHDVVMDAYQQELAQLAQGKPSFSGRNQQVAPEMGVKM